MMFNFRVAGGQTKYDYINVEIAVEDVAMGKCENEAYRFTHVCIMAILDIIYFK